MIYLGYHPDEQRTLRQKKIDAEEQYANRHKHSLHWNGRRIDTIEEYLLIWKRGYEYEDDNHIQTDLRNARAWAKTTNCRTTAERDRDDVEEITGGIGDVIKIVAFIFIVLVVAPAWPLLILLVIGGGIMGAGRWRGWF
jgi:hypothetical protein